MVGLKFDELDKFFRQGAKEEGSIPFREDAWEKMSLQLDRQRRRRRIIAWFGIFGILATLALILFLTGIIPDVDAPESPKVPTFSSPMAKLESDIPPLAQEKELKGELKPDKSPEEIKVDDSYAVLKDLEGTPEYNPSGVVPDEALADNEVAETLVDSVDKVKPGLKMQVHYDPLASISSKNFRVSIPEYEFEEKFFQASQQTKINQNIFSFGIQISPEWTSAGTDNFNKTNIKLGAQATYSFLNRLDVSLGVTYVSKKYIAGPDDYLAPYEVFHGRTIPSQTDAKCEILEIPFEITYHFLSSNRGNIFFGLGISNYLMLKEAYQYLYDRPVIDPIRYWHKLENELYWLGFGQVHLGYRAQLNQNYSVSFGPYFQIPFNGMGLGQVDLYSVGTQVRFNRVFHSNN